jgi:hypothetical protein
MSDQSHEISLAGICESEPVSVFGSPSNLTFTRLHARIIQEEGAFTVHVQMLNHLKQGESAWGERTAATIDVASSMIDTLAKQFFISANFISIKIVMTDVKDGTFH